MGMKIIWAAVIFFVGWLFSYLFIRQLVFNFRVAYPMVKKLRAQDKELVAPGADKYTNLSVVVCVVVTLIVFAVVLYLCRNRLYLSLCFFIGVVSALLLFWSHLKITDKGSFELFCSAYSRFVPDDELRTAMFERKPRDIRSRLRDMGLDDSVIPVFPG